MIRKEIKYILEGIIRRTQIETNYLSKYAEYDYWVDGDIDSYFEIALEKIGEGRKVKVTIEVIE